MKNKIALVTGASKGIGASISKRFVVDGIETIIVVARQSEEFSNLLAELNAAKSEGQKICSYVCDLSDNDAVMEFAGKMKSDFPNIDILINNAGYTAPQPIYEADFDEFRRTINVNLFAPFLLIQQLLHSGNNFTNILNIASTAAVKGRSGWLTYSSSKAALVAMSESLREELAPVGTRVTCISPGRCATDLRKKLAPDEDPTTIMQPEHVAEVVSMLLSETGGLIDSENIIVRL